MAGHVFFFEWEVTLMQWIQQHIGMIGVQLASLCSEFGEEIVMIAILGFLYWGYDKAYGKYVGINMLMALICTVQLKSVFLRRRPYLNHEGISCLKPVSKDADVTNLSAQGYSFPSGHSTNAAAAYGSLAAYKKKKSLWIAAIVMILLVGCSRVVVGMHYPTDVLGGWLTGGLSVAVGTVLQKKIKDQRLIYLLLILAGLPGMFFCRTEEYFTCYGIMIGAFAGFLFEEKYVNFKETEKWQTRILRILGGMVIFLGLGVVLKLPFSKEFLESGTFAAYLVRLVRYAVIAFVDIGVYPMIFKKEL